MTHPHNNPQGTADRDGAGQMAHPVNNRVIVVDQHDVIFLTTPANNGKTCVYVTLTLGGKLSFEGGDCICDTLDPHPATHTSAPAPDIDALKHDLDFKQACIENQMMHINALNAKMADMIQDAAKAAREQEFGVIRSRIHTKAPAPSTVVEDITFEGAAIVQEARAEAAKAAREQEIYTTLEVVRNTIERYEDNEDGTIEDALGDIRNHLEGSLIDVQEKDTLRTQQEAEQPKGERR